MHVQIPLSGGGWAISAASGRRGSDASPPRLFFQDRGGDPRANVSTNHGIREGIAVGRALLCNLASREELFESLVNEEAGNCL